MNMLEYALRETAVAVRIMFKNKSPLHVFNYGKDSVTGKEYVMVLSVLERSVAEKIFQNDRWLESNPVTLEQAYKETLSEEKQKGEGVVGIQKGGVQ